MIPGIQWKGDNGYFWATIDDTTYLGIQKEVIQGFFGRSRKDEYRWSICYNKEIVEHGQDKSVKAAKRACEAAYLKFVGRSG